MNKEEVLKKLRKKYDDTRALRDDSIDTVQRFRLELAKYTFGDLESHGKNPYFVTLHKKEKRFKKRYYVLDKRLNKLDTKINDILLKGQ